MKLALHWQILIALAVSVPVGMLTGTDGAIFGVLFYDIYVFLGTLFINALKMLIVPLVVSSIIVGVSNLDSRSGGFARMGMKTITYYVATSAIAIVIGLFLVNLTNPGIIDGQPASEVLGLNTQDVTTITDKVEGRGTGDIVEVFLRMVPPNIVSAAADGQMLGLIFFAVLFGFFITRLDKDKHNAQTSFWQSVFEVMMMMTHLIMRFAPIGVFALVAKVTATSGIEVFKPLAVFFFTVLGALLLHVLVVMPLILKFIAGVNPLAHYKAMAPALLTSFSTASSSATLPVTMDCVENRAGVSNKTTSFVLPLGATINMDGTALYECVAVLFIVQAYGIDLSVAQQLSVVILALLTSIGVAGIPSASLVAIVVILSTFNVPAEAIGLIFAVDRVLDMCRTSVNVFSDSCGAVVIGKSEGEEGILKAA